MKDVNKNKQQLMEEICKLRQTISTLEKSNRTYQEIFDKAPMLISAKDLNGTVLMANERCNLIKNNCDEQFVGKNVYEAFPPNVADVIWQNDLLALSSNELVEIEESIIHHEGDKHIYYTVIFPIEDEQQQTYGVGSLSYDITDIKHSVELSINDELTGLYTWRYFNIRFGGELHRAEQQRTVFTMLLIDIDFFDEYLQKYGQQWADDVVITVAGAIQNVCSRADDLCFRFNEQRMACLLSTSDQKDAKEIAEEIRCFVEALDIKNENSPEHEVITISIGLSIIHYQDEFNQEQIMTMTEKATELAHQHGGNTVCLAVKPEKPIKQAS